MALISPPAILLLSVSITLTLAANPIILNPPQHQTNTSSPLSILNTPPQTNLSNGEFYECTNSHYATGTTEVNCIDAMLNGMPALQNTTAGTWGNRSYGNFDYNLPQRYISGDGQCIIEVFLPEVGTRQPGISSQRRIGVAAHDVIDDCITGHNPPQAGISWAPDPSIRLKVQGYPLHTNVLCFLPAGFAGLEESCRNILDTMPATKNVTTFGFEGTGANVTVPFRLVSEDGICILTVRTRGQSVASTTWYEIWEGAVATAGMCARKGRDGRQINIGKEESIAVDLEFRKRAPKAIN